jgi:endonuclease YncB( thermonuclease family)
MTVTAQLETSTIDTKLFTFKGVEEYCKVVKVCDGDTVHIVCGMSFFGKPSEMYRFVARINGIDTPEIHDKDSTIRQRALDAKAEVARLLLNKIVKVKFQGPDKYGRSLIDITLPDGQDLAKYLLDKQLAHKYIGVTKTPW